MHETASSLHCGSHAYAGSCAADATSSARGHRSSHQYFFFTYSGSFTSTRSSLSFTRFLAADKSERACRCAHSLLNWHGKHLLTDGFSPPTCYVTVCTI